MKTFKRIMAGAIAVTTMAVGMAGFSASAATSDTFYVRHVNGAPGSESVSDTCAVDYSTYGSRATVLSASHSKTDGVGKGESRFNCTNFSMTQKVIKDTGTVICNPSVTGVVTTLKYSVSAYTSTQYNNFQASGKIVSRTSSSD